MKDNWRRDQARSDIGEYGRSCIDCSRGVQGNNCRRNGRFVIYISPELVSFDFMFFNPRSQCLVSEDTERRRTMKDWLGRIKVQLRAGVGILAEAKEKTIGE